MWTLYARTEGAAICIGTFDTKKEAEQEAATISQKHFVKTDIFGPAKKHEYKSDQDTVAKT
jgi:hypothetical protein